MIVSSYGYRLIKKTWVQNIQITHTQLGLLVSCKRKRGNKIGACRRKLRNLNIGIKNFQFSHKEEYEDPTLNGFGEENHKQLKSLFQKKRGVKLSFWI